jgi:predicted XRE-type DNA-binding protein
MVQCGEAGLRGTPPRDRSEMMVAKAKVRSAKPIEIEPSSGNVFEDLGLPDAAARLAKAELARVIRKIVTDKGWTQRRAAEVVGIAPPDMSDLMRGKLARFSQERLERFLNALDMDVRIQVGPRRKGKKHANVTVELVGAF